LTETHTPEELSAAGKAAFENGDYPEAAQNFLAAAEGYRLTNDPINAAEMENNRSVTLMQTGEAAAALAAVQDTIPIFQNAGDTRRLAMAHGNQAAALEALGQLDEAETAYQQSADLLGEAGEDQLRASVLRSVSELQLRQGRHLEAVASMQTGLGGLKKPKPKQRLIRRLLDMPFKLLNRS
jgi:tetratricopeptide (TPR) repeat protein